MCPAASLDNTEEDSSKTQECRRESGGRDWKAGIPGAGGARIMSRTFVVYVVLKLGWKCQTDLATIAQTEHLLRSIRTKCTLLDLMVFKLWWSLHLALRKIPLHFLHHVVIF
jgi:hypothetical protein